ncbi:MAG: hypothetical protein KAR19_20115 [Bacteroidales bacterium]|nr:hypothetical protein [Bacteroidales bacterium]
MKRKHAYAATVFSLIFAIQAFTQETRLSYNLQPGERYVLDVDIQQNTHSESINSEEINLFNQMKLEFNIDSTDNRGLIYMTVCYRDLLLSMLAPGLAININSGTGENRMLSDMVDSLQKGTFRVVMDHSGELKSLEGMAQLFQSLASLPAADTNEQQVILKTLDEVYGQDSFKSIFSLFVSVYPVIQPIANWTSDITYFFNTKPVQMVNRFYLTRTTDEVVIIQGLGMLNSMGEFQEKTNMGEVKSGVSGSQTYDFQMDKETGWLKRCVSRQRVVIETIIISGSYLPAGLMIPSYTETVFEVKGARL